MTDPAVFNTLLAEQITPRTIRLQRLVRGPIERVWAFLVDSDQRRRWLAEGPMDLRAGGVMSLTWHNRELTEHPGPVPASHANDAPTHTMTGTILACEPPRLLRFSWVIGDTPTEVSFELMPQDDLVLLVMTHRALGSFDALLSVSAGWDTHVGLLVELLAERKRDGFWTRFARLEALYRDRLAGDSALSTARDDA